MGVECRHIILTIIMTDFKFEQNKWYYGSEPRKTKEENIHEEKEDTCRHLPTPLCVIFQSNSFCPISASSS